MWIVDYKNVYRDGTIKDKDPVGQKLSFKN